MRVGRALQSTLTVFNVKSGKTRVLIIVENNSVPFDTRVWKEACTLEKHGFQVVVLCPKRRNSRKTYEYIQGVHVYRHPIAKEGNGPTGYIWEYSCALLWEFIFAAWIYLRRGFNIIQGCNPPDTIVVVALPFKIFGVRYIFDHHDLTPELYLAKYRKTGLLFTLLCWLEALTFRFSNVVMSTNASYANVALNRGRVNARDIFVVRNGPYLSTFRLVDPDAALKFGKKYLVGYVGTIAVQEGLDILIEVAEYIRNLGRKDIHFTCVGGGPGLADLQKLVVQRQLADMVNFTGRISDAELLRVLSTADVCVNPDRPCQMNDMSTMIKIMEYMALGKPIVQFDLKEGRFSAMDASLYADNENQVADFATKILWLLDRPEERARMGEFGRKRVVEELAWEYSVQNLLAAYRRASDEQRGSDSFWLVR